MTPPIHVGLVQHHKTGRECGLSHYIEQKCKHWVYNSLINKLVAVHNGFNDYNFFFKFLYKVEFLL